MSTSPAERAAQLTRIIRVALSALCLWVGLGVATQAAEHSYPRLTLDALRAKYANRNGHIANLDGVDVYYQDEGSGPAILLVHGSVSSLRTYDGVTAQLRAHYRVIRYDVPAQGLSGSVSDEAASRLEPADIAEKLLQKLNVTEVTAVGVSSGGTLCIDLAARKPGLVKRLILSNTPSDPVDTSHLQQSSEFVEAQKQASETHFQSQHFWDLFLEYFTGEPQRLTPAIREQYYDFNRRVPENNALSLVAKVADHDKAVTAMSHVSQPTLLVWGARDPLLTPATADILAGYLTHAPVSKLLLPDVGHFPPLEVPERFAAIVAAYIEAVTPTRTAAHAAR